MRATSRSAVAIIALVTMGTIEDTYGDDQPGRPHPGVAALQPLDHWAGEWTTQMKSPEGHVMDGTAQGRWIHDGRFLRQSWTIEGKGAFPSMTGHSIATYDPQRQEYRQWNFNSSGTSLEMVGTWDAEKKTMIWRGKDASGNEITNRSSFPDRDTEQWSIEVKPAGSSDASKFTGVSNRK